MKIAIITPWEVSPEAVGGTERYTIDLATGLHRRGHNVEVFSLSGTNTQIDEVPYTSLDIMGNNRVATEHDLQEYAGSATDQSFYDKWASIVEDRVELDDFDVIQLNSFLFAGTWKGRPRILTIHTNPYEYQLDWGKAAIEPVAEIVRTDSERRLILVAPSTHYGKIFSKVFGREVLTIPHAIDPKRLAATRQHVATPCSDKTTKLLLPSRLEPIQKRPQIVFRGVARLPKDVKEQLEIVATGKDGHYETNDQEMRDISLAGGFGSSFVKYSSMTEAYESADIVALPSRSESFGYSALEALSLGKPTILNAIPTFREIGEGNPNAHFFERTSGAFARVLKKVLNDLEPKPISPEWHERYDVGAWIGAYEQLFTRLRS